jgi:hypothetical protein
MVGTMLVVVHDATHPSDSDWQIYLDAIRANRDVIVAQLIVTDGGSPNASQRRASLEFARDRPVPVTAVISGSVLVRGVVSALSWFMKDRIRAFARDEFDEACEFVGASRNAARVSEVVDRLRKTLPAA